MSDALRPLLELDARGVVGVVFDVDDTVTREGRLEREAFDAMWALRDAGVHAVAVTGRPLGWCDVIARQWPIDGAVGENGAGWVAVRDGHVSFGHAVEGAAWEAQRAALEGIAARVRRELPHVQPADDQPARRRDLAFDVGEHVTLPAADVALLVALIEAEGARSLVSSVHAHAFFGAHDKARGADDFFRARGLERDRDRWIFVGDSGNDAAAFAGFPRSVGVANVRAHLPRLPVPPRYVTEGDRGRGFAELVRHVLVRR